SDFLTAKGAKNAKAAPRFLGCSSPPRPARRQRGRRQSIEPQRRRGLRDFRGVLTSTAVRRGNDLDRAFAQSRFALLPKQRKLCGLCASAANPNLLEPSGGGFAWDGLYA